MSEIEASGLFAIGAPEDFPPGTVVVVVEREGSAHIRYAEGHASPELCEQLTTYHVGILNKERLWKQDWSDDPDRLKPSETEQPPVASARYVIVQGEALPRDAVCWPIEVPGEFIWQVREGHMSEEARQQMNRYLDIVVGGGRWRQQD